MKQHWQQETVIGGWAIALARTLDYYQIDSQAAFRAQGLSLSTALDTNSRYPITKISQLIRQAVSITGDENFGLLIAKHIRPTSWHALGISIWASRNLAEGYGRVVRYSKIFNTALEASQHEEDGMGILTLSFTEAYQPLLCDTDMDAVMATTVLTSRYLVERHIKPKKIRMTRPSPSNPGGFHRLFRCQVEFDCDANQIIYSLEDLHAPMLTANAELAMLNDGLIQQYLSRLERHDIVNQVYNKLVESLGHNRSSDQLLNQQALAESLHLSQRNLQRKLQQAGTSYQEMLDQLRHELSLQYLEQSHLSINEISYLLGFAKVASFSRAFHRWRGESASQYRQRHSKALDPASLPYAQRWKSEHNPKNRL